MAKLVINIAKNIGGTDGVNRHIERKYEACNVDGSRSHLNHDLVALPGGMDMADQIDHLIQQHYNHRTKTGKLRGIRKDAVRSINVLLSASPEYFRPDDPDRPGRYNQDRLQAFEKAALQWLQSEGWIVARATVHLDETTPHIHSTVIPIVDGKLQARTWDGPANLAAVHDRAAKYFEGIGIERGESKSLSWDQKIAYANEQHQAAAKTAEHHQEAAKAATTLKQLQAEAEAHRLQAEVAIKEAQKSKETAKTWMMRAEKYRDEASELQERIGLLQGMHKVLMAVIPKRLTAIIANSFKGVLRGIIGHEPVSTAFQVACETLQDTINRARDRELWKQTCRHLNTCQEAFGKIPGEYYAIAAKKAINKVTKEVSDIEDEGIKM